jgi:hypothetical protein
MQPHNSSDDEGQSDLSVNGATQHKDPPPRPAATAASTATPETPATCLAAFGVGPLTSAGVALPAIFAASAAVAVILGGLSLAVAHRQPSPAAVHPRPARPRPRPGPAVRTGKATA